MADTDNAVRDGDGFILRIPYMCWVEGCNEGFDTKHQRAGHVGGAHNTDHSKLRTPIEHGTPQGARKHRVRGEDVCQPCKDAWAAYMRENRRKPKQPRTKNYLPPSLERFRRP